METVLFKDGMGNFDDIYTKNCKLFNEWFQKKIWEYSKINLEHIINSINNIKEGKELIYEYQVEGTNTVVMANLMELELHYDFDTERLKILVVDDSFKDGKSEIYKIFRTIEILGAKEGLNGIKNARLTITDKDKVLLNTTFGAPSYIENYPIDGVNFFCAYEQI